MTKTKATMTPAASPGALKFPPARRIAAARFGWRLAKQMRRQQRRLYYSSLLASLVVAVLQLMLWNRNGGNFIHATFVDRLPFFGASLLRQLVLLPASYATFTRLHLDDRGDQWLWQSGCWRDGRFIGLFLGIALCSMLPGLLSQLAPLARGNRWVNETMLFIVSVAGVVVYYYTTKIQILAPALVMHDPRASLRPALQRSKGHFWNLALGQFCANVPLIVLMTVLYFLAYPLMMGLAHRGYVPLLNPIKYLTAYAYVVWGLFGTRLCIAQMTVVSAFYEPYERIADAF